MTATKWGNFQTNKPALHKISSHLICILLEKKWKNQVFQEYNMNNWFTSKLITYIDIDQILWGEIRVFKYYQCPSWMKKAFGSVPFALHCKGWKQKLFKSTEKKSSLHLNQQTFEETHMTSNVNPCSTVCMTKTKVLQIKSVLVGDSHEYQPWAVPPFWQSVVRVKKNKWKKKLMSVHHSVSTSLLQIPVVQ